jgi:hypothetical protein
MICEERSESIEHKPFETLYIQMYSCQKNHIKYDLFFMFFTLLILSSHLIVVDCFCLGFTGGRLAGTSAQGVAGQISDVDPTQFGPNWNAGM